MYFATHSVLHRKHSKICCLFVWSGSHSVRSCTAVVFPPRTNPFQWPRKTRYSVVPSDLAFEETGDKSEDVPLTVTAMFQARSIEQNGDSYKIFSYAMRCEDTKLSTNLTRHCVHLSEIANSYCYDRLNVWLERNRDTRYAYKLFGKSGEGTAISFSRWTLQFNPLAPEFSLKF